MKQLPWILVALVIVGGVLAWVILKNPKQHASVDAGTPTVGPALSEGFINDVGADLGYV